MPADTVVRRRLADTGGPPGRQLVAPGGGEAEGLQLWWWRWCHERGTWYEVPKEGTWWNGSQERPWCGEPEDCQNTPARGDEEQPIELFRGQQLFRRASSKRDHRPGDSPVGRGAGPKIRGVKKGSNPYENLFCMLWSIHLAISGNRLCGADVMYSMLSHH